MPRYLSADDAAEKLGVTKNTLYAYVSRGLVRSEPDDSNRRTRRYRADDIERLRRKTKRRQDPETAARTALDWGLPVMESGITLIEDGCFYYRGQDACQLAKTHALEEIAPLLWNVDTERVSLPTDALPLNTLIESTSPEASPLARLQTLLPQAQRNDDHAHDRSPSGVAGTGLRVMALLTALAAGPETTAAHDRITDRLGRAWEIDDADKRALLDTTLVLCADHGLNVTAFSVRCVASAGTTPYGAIGAGLSTVQGLRHTGNTARIDALFREAGSPDRFRATVADRIHRDDTVPGFGHRLYPEGDPRARLIIDRLQSAAPDADGTAMVTIAAEVGPELLGRYPALDFALVALGRALDLPRNAPLTLFTLGRMVGWTGHLIEQYDREQVIRPRAQYVGPPPESSP